MPNADIITLIGQLGASGIFALAVVIVAKTFYDHYENEIKYLREKVDQLSDAIIELENQSSQNLH